MADQAALDSDFQNNQVARVIFAAGAPHDGTVFAAVAEGLFKADPKKLQALCDIYDQNGNNLVAAFRTLNDPVLLGQSIDAFTSGITARQTLQELQNDTLQAQRGNLGQLTTNLLDEQTAEFRAALAARTAQAAPKPVDVTPMESVSVPAPPPGTPGPISPFWQGLDRTVASVSDALGITRQEPMTRTQLALDVASAVPPGQPATTQVAATNDADNWLVKMSPDGRPIFNESKLPHINYASLGSAPDEKPKASPSQGIVIAKQAAPRQEQPMTQSWLAQTVASAMPPAPMPAIKYDANGIPLAPPVPLTSEELIAESHGWTLISNAEAAPRPAATPPLPPGQRQQMRQPPQQGIASPLPNKLAAGTKPPETVTTRYPAEAVASQAKPQTQPNPSMLGAMPPGATSVTLTPTNNLLTASQIPVKPPAPQESAHSIIPDADTMAMLGQDMGNVPNFVPVENGGHKTNTASNGQGGKKPGKNRAALNHLKAKQAADTPHIDLAHEHAATLAAQQNELDRIAKLHHDKPHGYTQIAQNNTHGPTGRKPSAPKA